MEGKATQEVLIGAQQEGTWRAGRDGVGVVGCPLAHQVLMVSLPSTPGRAKCGGDLNLSTPLVLWHPANRLTVATV